MIQLERVTYRYPDQTTPALRDASLSLPPGSFTLVVGASGGGKSTLLRTLNGLVPHFYGGVFRGRVRMGDADPVALTPRRMGRHVGLVFQDPEAQFVVSTVEDELAFGMENFGVPLPVMRQRIETVLGRLGIGHLRGRRIETLSGGEKQRVAIAAVLTLQPSVLVLDEPTSQLDPQGAADVLAAIDELHRAAGLTVMLAEHRVERVVERATHVLTIEEGHPTVGDARAQLAHHPLAPPVTRLGAALGWTPVPLTVAGAERLKIDDERFQIRGGGRKTEDGTPRSSVITHQSFGPPVLTLAGVHARYGERAALRGVDLAVRQGEVVALMGRNGAGKTTLLKVAMGLLATTAGRVSRLGQAVRGGETATLARRVGYVPQNPSALLFADTVRDEVLFTRRIHRLPGLGESLMILGLEGLADAYPRDLSVGQRQRVALAAVLAAEPALLLLDEPTRGLDTLQKADLAALLRRLTREGAAILLTTHDVELAAMAADRIIVLDEGRVVHDGPTAAVMRAAPAFANQIAHLWPDSGWLTVDDVLAGHRAYRVA
ncbi:MAG: ATP-binding cassette domain-containing protein [Anaerolineae bacterium]|nr:ATP-binding cassette domain-containing protein [Anaerolineae bacterium]